MSRNLVSTSPLFLAITLLAVATPASAQISPDDGAWKVKGDFATVTAGGIGIPVRAGSVSLSQTGEASQKGKGVDNIAQYESDDRKVFATIYIFYATYADTALATWATDRAIHERFGAEVRFKRSDVIALDWGEERSVPPPPPAEYREYWERCLVDRCVVDDGVKVDYIYREEPDMAGPDDAYPDSGWRIRGDYRDVDDAEIDSRKAEYIALGVVLNRDDSWLHLIDAPVGAAFRRNWETGLFETCED